MNLGLTVQKDKRAVFTLLICCRIQCDEKQQLRQILGLPKP
jgi:hypothetical protein